MTTVNEIRQDVIKLLAQVAGTGTQLYSEDKLLIHIRNAFNSVFDKDFWQEYCTWSVVTLDGTLGQMTTNVDYKNYRNIRGVWVAATDRPVVPFPRRMNPFAVTGTSPRYWRAQHDSTVDPDDKPISFLPITATGTVSIYGRVHPGESNTDFNADTDIKLDRDLITFTAALDYASDDGDNPAMIAKLEAKARDRYKLVKPQGDVVSTPRAPDIPDQWYDSP